MIISIRSFIERKTEIQEIRDKGLNNNISIQFNYYKYFYFTIINTIIRYKYYNFYKKIYCLFIYS